MDPALLAAIPALVVGVWIGRKIFPRTVHTGLSREDRDYLDEVGESLLDARARTVERERQIAVMTVARDPAQMDALAAARAVEIDDVFARGGQSAEARRKDVAAIVRRAVEDALKGGGPKFI